MCDPSVLDKMSPPARGFESATTNEGKLAGLVSAAAVAVLATILFAAAVSASFGNADAAMVNAYDTDEFLGLTLRQSALRSRAPFYQGEYFEHGSVYPALTYGALRLLESLGFTLTDKLIIVVSRGLSLLAFAFLLWLTYRLARSLGLHRPLSWVAPAIVACTPDFFYYAQIIHPDTLQAALIVLAFVVAFRRHDFRHALGACSVLGVATATKLAGAYALPFVILPASLTVIARTPAIGRWRALLTGWIGCALVAAGSFFAVDLEALLQFGRFVERIHRMQGILAVGWGKVEPKNPFLWLGVIRQQYGIALSLVLATGLLATGIWTIRWMRTGIRERRELATDEQHVRGATLLLYFSIIFMVVALQVNWRGPRYLQHLLPAGVVVGIFGIDRLIQLGGRRLRILGSLAAAAVLYLAGMRATASIRTLAPPLSQRESSGIIKASEWILATYGPDVAIVADPYTYRAPAFRNWRGDICVAQKLAELERDQALRLMVISSSGSGRYVWKRGPSFSAERLVTDSAYPQTAQYLDFLQRVLRGAAPWKIALDSEEILVLERTSGANR